MPYPAISMISYKDSPMILHGMNLTLLEKPILLVYQLYMLIPGMIVPSARVQWLFSNICKIIRMIQNQAIINT
jgi:hypothetical protein